MQQMPTMRTVSSFDDPPGNLNTRPRGFRSLLIYGSRMLVPVLLFLWGLWSFPLALFGPDRNMVPDDRGHARLNNYVLEHFHAYISGRTADYHDAPFIFPQKNAMARTDGLLGTAPIYSLFRQAGVERETSYQLWLLALFALNYWCSFLVVLAWLKRPWLAACGAFLFAFGVYGTVHMGHAELLPRFLIPVTLFLLWRWLSTARPLYIMLATVAMVGQFYCSRTLGLILLYGSFSLLAAHTLIHRGNTAWLQLRGRQLFLSLGGTLLLAATLLAPLLVHHLQGGYGLDAGPFAERASIKLSVGSLFRAPATALSWQDLTRHSANGLAGRWQASLFLGGVPWLAILVTVVLLWRRLLPTMEKQTLATVALAWCITVLITLLPITSDPLIKVGMVNLHAVFMMLLIVLLVGWVARQGRWWAVSLAAVFPLLLVVDNRLDPRRADRYDKHSSRTAIAQVRTRLQGHPPTVPAALAYGPVLPVVHDSIRSGMQADTQLSAMLAAQELSIPIVNAYADVLPHEFLPFFGRPDREALQQWCAFSDCDTAQIQWRDNVGLPIHRVERLRLMAYDGRYVCADAGRHGALTTNRPEAEWWQGLVLVLLADGRAGIMVHSGHWVWVESFKNGSLLGDSPELGDLGLFNVERDANGRMALRCADGRFVMAMEDGSLAARTDTLSPAAWFTPAPLPKGYQ